MAAQPFVVVKDIGEFSLLLAQGNGFTKLYLRF
jgi:hypothetical protein